MSCDYLCPCRVATMPRHISSRHSVAKMLPSASSAVSNGGKCAASKGTFLRLSRPVSHVRVPLPNLQPGYEALCATVNARWQRAQIACCRGGKIERRRCSMHSVPLSTVRALPSRVPAVPCAQVPFECIRPLSGRQRDRTNLPQ